VDQVADEQADVALLVRLVGAEGSRAGAGNGVSDHN
jgi:hypothetical protein